MKIGKKGIIFTMVSIVISAIIITAFFFQQTTPPDQNTQYTELRIKSINNYINQIDQFVSSQMSRTMYKAFDNITKTMISDDNYYASSELFDEAVENCLLKGEYNSPNGAVVVCEPSFIDTINDFVNISQSKLNIPSEFIVTGIEFNQTSPWVVTFNVNMSINITDGYGVWLLNRTYGGNTTILGLPDPTYEINIAPALGPFYYPNNFTTKENILNSRYPSDLNLLALNKQYFPYDNAPNFLNRLRGNLTAQDSTGIVSVIIPEAGMPIASNIPHIDSAFWTQNTCAGGSVSSVVQLDFFTKIDTYERSRLGINETMWGESINNANLPGDLLISMNMSSPDYINSFPDC